MKSTAFKATKTAGFLLLVTLIGPLSAKTTTDYTRGWYMGGSAGKSFANIDEQSITQNLTNFTYSDDENDHGYKFFGGYQFNKYFAIEGGYFNLGKFNYALSTAAGNAYGNIKVEGVNLDILALMPVTDKFSAFARAGANYAQSKDRFNSNASLPLTSSSTEDEDLNYKFGVGLQYALTDALGFRVEAERYRINDAVSRDGDIDLVSIGLTYRFGATKKEATPIPTRKTEYTPAPKDKEVEILVVLTEPYAEKKIKESVAQKKTVALVFEEIHFGFDKSALSEDAKGALKRNIAQLGKNPNLKMLIAGHTSLSGTEEYNQGLSEERAQSVKDYLVEEDLFQADKITIIGYGKTRPTSYEESPQSDVYSKAAKANMRVLLKIKHD